MIFLEADLAIFKRLTGAPLDNKGRPVVDATTKLPVNRNRIEFPEYGGGTTYSWGIRIPVMKTPHNMSNYLSTQDQEALPLFKGFSSNTYRQVPIFDENLEGRKHQDVYPSVTFKWTNVYPDQSVAVYNDPFDTFDPTSSNVTIRNRSGDVVDTGKSARIYRPHPDSYKVQYTMIAQAKTQMELGLVCAQIMYLFPTKGGLVVEWANGESHTCDMNLESVVTLDPGLYDQPMSIGGEEQRGYRRAFIYEVELYMDNTTNGYGTSDIRTEPDLIYQRILELSDIQDQVIRRSELNEETIVE